MKQLYAFRSMCIGFYKKWDIYIIPVCRFIVAFFALILINLNLGYMDALNKIYIVIVVAVICALMPLAGTVAAGIIFIILHCFGLHLFIGIFASALYAVIFIFVMRFITKDSLALVLGPVTFMLGIPATVPVALGLMRSALSVLTGICTVISWCFLDTLNDMARYIAIEEPSGIEVLQQQIEALIYHKDLIIYCICFSLSLLAVYLIKTLVHKFGFLIAAASGCVVFFIVRLVSCAVLKVPANVPKEILGMFLSILISAVLTFFLYSLDYKKTKLLQFEDDEYYYFVKAVPKIIADKKETELFEDFYEEEDEDEYDEEDFDSDDTWKEEQQKLKDSVSASDATRVFSSEDLSSIYSKADRTFNDKEQ